MSVILLKMKIISDLVKRAKGNEMGKWGFSTICFSGVRASIAELFLSCFLMASASGCRSVVAVAVDRGTTYDTLKRGFLVARQVPLRDFPVPHSLALHMAASDRH